MKCTVCKQKEAKWKSIILPSPVCGKCANGAVRKYVEEHNEQDETRLIDYYEPIGEWDSDPTHKVNDTVIKVSRGE